MCSKWVVTIGIDKHFSFERVCYYTNRSERRETEYNQFLFWWGIYYYEEVCGWNISLYLEQQRKLSRKGICIQDEIVNLWKNMQYTKSFFFYFCPPQNIFLLFLDLVSWISYFDCWLLPYYLVCQLWSTLEIPKSVAHVSGRNKVVEVGYPTITFIWLDNQLIITHWNIFFITHFFHSTIVNNLISITFWRYAIFSFIEIHISLIWRELECFLAFRCIKYD